MLKTVLDNIPFVRNAADEQLGYESFKRLIDEKFEDYQNMTLPDLISVLKTGCSDLGLSKDRPSMLYDYIVRRAKKENT